VDEDETEWGLSKGMELFEVSAKDDFGMLSLRTSDGIDAYPGHAILTGIQTLFDHLITAIIERKDRIEQENELKKRDSVFLSAVPTPTWSAQAEEEEAREKAERAAGGWSCC
jgi:hypothetical protein